MEDILSLTMSQRSEIGKRIGLISTTVCPSKADFAKSVGITPQNLHNWISRGANLDAVELITAVHRQVNPDWLINGEGEPINKDVNFTSNNEQEHNGKRIDKVARYLCSNLSEFARMLGVKPITVKSWIANGVDTNIIDTIVSRFPNVNHDYLISGTGKPLLEDKQINKQIGSPALNISLDTLGGRLSYIITNTCKSKVEFANIIGEKPQTIQRWCKSGAPMNKIQLILSKFPIVNSDWLINGNGLPFLDNPQENSALQNTTELSPDELQSLLQQSGIPTTSASAEEREARAYEYMRTINDNISKMDDNLFPQEEKTIPSGGSEIMNQVVQALTSTINSLTAQLSDKDKIIMKQMDHIASLDERIRQLEKLMYQNNLNA